jgi:hypothetical protein
MKKVLALFGVLVLIGCGGSGTGSRSGSGVQPEGCSEKLDLSSVAHAASSAFRVRQACSLAESEVVKSAPN